VAGGFQEPREAAHAGPANADQMNAHGAEASLI
jgi:hypothetical protein